MQPALCTNQFVLLSRSLGRHVRALWFDLGRERSGQSLFAHHIAQTLPNLPNIRYLNIGCHEWETVTNSAITNAIAKLQHLEWVSFGGRGCGSNNEIYSPPLPTFFDTTFNQILSSRAEQLTLLSLTLCPFHCAPGTFQLLRETTKNLQVLTLTAALPRSLWQVFSQPVVWACADRLIMLEIIDIHGLYVPTLVEHIASGRFGNLKQLLIDMDMANHDQHTMIPAIEWNIRPLDVLLLSQVPKLELEFFGCLHAKDVHVEGVPEQAMIELVQGAGFKEMTVLRIWQQDWKHTQLEELASAVKNRNAELLFLTL